MEQNRNFLWGFKAHQSTIKVFLVLFLGVFLSMFLIGNVSAAEGDYITSYAVSGGCGALEIWGGYAYIENGYIGKNVTKYFLNNFTSTGFTFSLGGGEIDGYNSDIGTDGTFLWFGGDVKEYVSKYWMNGTLSSTFSTSGQGTDGNPRGVTTDNTSIWVINNLGRVDRYNMIGAFQDYFNQSVQEITGLQTNGTFIWIVDILPNKMYKYFMNGTNHSNWALNTTNSNPIGIGIVEDSIYVCDSSKNRIFEYDRLPTSTPSFLVNLTSPANTTVSSTSNNSFSVNLSMSGTNYSYSWVNNTYYVWFNNGTLFNTTYLNGLSTNLTNFSRTISNFTIGSYLWNSYACYGNTTFSNCSWATSNNTFTIGSSVNSITYNNNTYETSLEQFIINFTLAEGAQLSLAKLNYNGTNYTISNITSVGNNYILERTINIPLNVNASANQTNTFYVIFTYEGTFIQTSSSYTQNSSFINLVKCGAPYTIQALNFTFYNEYSQSNINAATNKTTLYSSFKYWLGDGTIYKNYSFQNISSTLNNYQFCIYPYFPNNYTFKTNMDMEFYAEDFRENKYYLRNSTLTNTSNNILLYLLPEEYATKFFLTFKQGTSAISDATVTVQKYFTGLGMYKTVAILLTDADGKATMWQEVDKTFKYSIVKNGVLLGTIERVSICSATPCSLTIMTTTAIDSAFEAYDEYYAVNVLSNLSYNKNTNMVTYSFIDVTGLANYFRLEVKQVKLNSAGVTICDTTSYSSAGTLSCNLTGYDGDFFATGYVSRSPEMVDKILSFVIDEDVLGDLGITGVFIVMILLITLVIAAAVISRGNPTTVLFVLGMSILGTKLIGLFPFTWIVVVTLEVLIIFMIFKIKT